MLAKESDKMTKDIIVEEYKYKVSYIKCHHDESNFSLKLNGIKFGAILDEMGFIYKPIRVDRYVD